MDKLQSKGVRVELDNRNETISKKIKEATNEKIPYVLIVGDKECADNLVSVRVRGKGDVGAFDMDAFTTMLLDEIASKKLNY